MKKQLLLTFLAVLTLHVTATAQTNLDEWTFTDGVAPQTSDILSKTMGNWDPSLPDNSVPSAGILRDATAGNSSGAFWGDNLGLGAMPNNVVLTVEIADINHTQRDYWFEFLGVVGGTTRLDINSFNGGIVIDLWGAGTKHYDGPSKIFDTDDYTGAISLTVTATWDFANNTIGFTLSGDGVGYTGTGSSAFSDTQIVPADLSAITNIKSMRVRGGAVETGEYIDLDRVAITYDAPTLSTPNTVLDNAKVWYSNSANALHIEGITAQSVRVYALSGAKVAQYDNPGNTITLEDLSSGLYIASVLSEHGTKTFKFVK